MSDKRPNDATTRDMVIASTAAGVTYAVTKDPQAAGLAALGSGALSAFFDRVRSTFQRDIAI